MMYDTRRKKVRKCLAGDTDVEFLIHFIFIFVFLATKQFYLAQCSCEMECSCRRFFYIYIYSYSQGEREYQLLHPRAVKRTETGSLRIATKGRLLSLKDFRVIASASKARGKDCQVIYTCHKDQSGHTESEQKKQVEAIIQGRTEHKSGEPASQPSIPQAKKEKKKERERERIRHVNSFSFVSWTCSRSL